ncbi:hypothetical protein V8F06_007417 [Rhypophila decipiens]
MAQQTQTSDRHNIRKLAVEERATKRQRKVDDLPIQEGGLDPSLMPRQAGSNIEELADLVVADECGEGGPLQGEFEDEALIGIYSTLPHGLGGHAGEVSAQDGDHPSGLLGKEVTPMPLEPPDPPAPALPVLTSPPLTITPTNSNSDFPDPDLFFPLINLDFTALLGAASESADGPFYQDESLISIDMDQIDPFEAVAASPDEAWGDGLRNPLLPRQQHESHDGPGLYPLAPAYSEFGSRLPSTEPEEHQNMATPNHHPQPKQWLPHLSSNDRAEIETNLAEFATITQNFRLPTRLALSRYLRGYIEGFHQHLPFLHIPTLTVQSCPVELLLAMAAVGTQYCFEADKGVDLFVVARVIATERISSTAIGINLIPTAQALLILMAMATWGNHQQIIHQQATRIQSILAGLLREDGLVQRREEISGDTHDTWQTWSRAESTLRTKYIAYCFFNLHNIVYGIPPAITTSEISMRLPCSDAEFKATTKAEWHQVRATRTHHSPTNFQVAFRKLFSPSLEPNDTGNPTYSSLGNYILINAIIQHTFFARIASCRFPPALLPEHLTVLERALSRWQRDWERSQEPSFDPMDHNNAVSFNSTALLRLAKIRLHVNFGPRGLALGSRDPGQVAQMMREIPRPLQRSPELLRALEHAAHAFSIPVKIGVSLVARTQPFIWSIQHSLCSLECALLLSKWLEVLSTASTADYDLPLAEKEEHILRVLEVMLAETEFELPAGPRNLQDTARCINIGVLRVWASIFRGSQTWAVVDTIGTALDLYADMLEESDSDAAAAD